jgi:hypothetical protein
VLVWSAHRRLLSRRFYDALETADEEHDQPTILLTMVSHSGAIDFSFAFLLILILFFPLLADKCVPRVHKSWHGAGGPVDRAGSVLLRCVGESKVLFHFVSPHLLTLAFPPRDTCGITAARLKMRNLQRHHSQHQKQQRQRKSSKNCFAFCSVVVLH